METHNELQVHAPLVYVVDDDVAVRDSLKFSLEVAGMAVRTYPRAEELLLEPNLAQCQCFVIDQRLPGLSGLALIEKLRELNVRAPAILITSNVNEMLRKRAARLNTPIVEKPLLNDSLLHSIERAVYPAASIRH